MTTNTNTPQQSDDKFEDFLLAEYNNIANAHFATGTQASTFFNYYLLILAAPAVIITLFEKSKSDESTDSLYKIITDPVTNNDIVLHWISVVVLFLISIIGLFVCWIVIEHSLDKTLYARTVNGIREYFYQKKALGQALESKIRVLPKDVTKPRFFSAGDPIVTAFAIANTAYLGLGIVVYFKADIHITANVWILCGACLIYFITHFIIYAALAKRKAKHYK